MQNRGYRPTSDTNVFIDDNRESQDKLIKIYYCLHSKLNVDVMKTLIRDMENSNLYHAIIVYAEVITSSCKRILENMMRFVFETWNLFELQYDITKHSLYSPHYLATHDEIKALKTARLNIKDLPVLLKNDAVVRYFNFKKGDVIKIDRKNGITAYRIIK